MIFYQSALISFLKVLLSEFRIDFPFNVLYPFDLLLNSSGKVSAKKVQFMVDLLDLHEKTCPGRTQRFLDCGAFSAMRQGFTIDLNEYISFAKEHSVLFDVVTSLDVINDPESTWENYVKMRDSGLTSAVPVYHVGEPESALLRLVQNAEYMGFSPPMGLSGGETLQVFHAQLYNPDATFRFPNTKFHGFGVGSPSLLEVYPWYSCDATTPAIFGRYGRILILYPSPLTGRIVWSNVLVSSKQKTHPKHMYNLSRPMQSYVESVIHSYGFSFSDFEEDSYEKISYAMICRVAFNLKMFWAVVRDENLRIIKPSPRLL